MIKNPLPALLALAALTLPLHAQELKWDKADLGPFHSGCYQVRNTTSYKGVAVAVGTPEAPAAMLFDTELLRFHAAWEGKLAVFPRGRGGLDGTIRNDAEVQLSNGWAVGWGAEVKDDPRARHQGAAPGLKWRGIYLNGARTVLSYAVGNQAILELPGSEMRDGLRIYTRTFTVAPGAEARQLQVLEAEGSARTTPGKTVLVTRNGPAVAVALRGGPNNAMLVGKDGGGRVSLHLPALTAPATFQVAFGSAPAADAEKLVAALEAKAELPDVTALTKGGPARWGAALETQGKLGTGDGPYVVDEITAPDDNPYNSWLRFGGHDFFPNGDAAVVNVSGDVWLVSGLDAKLEKVKWKRIATGLFQPLGCKVVDGKIYVLGRDQITRLHDLNGDGEADYYENFNNDCVVTDNYHEFALDLQTDSAGNFYYAKGAPWEPTTKSPHQGTMLRVSKDGAKMDIVATGLRAPNGLGMGPKDILTCSDNQGHWMPANRLNIIKPGGFYGMTPAAHKVLRFKAADGTEFDANPSSEEARKEFKTNFWGKAETPIPTAGYDLPLVWLPQAVDNSPGGEVWVSGGKWGPWEGRMLHLSYGHCLLYGVTMETVGGVTQGAVVKFPFKFSSGIMRGRFHPKDGQLYVSGLNVWQSDAAKFGCFSRVRYTGAPVTMPVELHALKDGVQLQFTNPLDATSATDPQNYDITRWNYQWTGAYGSPDFKVSDGTKGKDAVPVEKAVLSADKKTLTLTLPDMQPAMTLRLKFKIQSADGKPVEQEIHSTIHRVPGMAVK